MDRKLLLKNNNNNAYVKIQPPARAAFRSRQRLKTACSLQSSSWPPTGGCCLFRRGSVGTLSLSHTLFFFLFPPTYLFLFFRWYTGRRAVKQERIEAQNYLYARTPDGGGGGGRHWSTEPKSQGQGLACATFSAAVYDVILLLLL